MQPSSFFRNPVSSLAGISKRPARAAIIAVCVTLTLAAVLLTRFNFNKHFEGVYVLRGEGIRLVELKNGLLLGEEGRLVWGHDFEDPRIVHARAEDPGRPGQAYLEYEWDPATGSGFVSNHYPGGRTLQTVFSRYEGEDGNTTHGLFVGGALSRAVESRDPLARNNSGMSYFDGTRWLHIWCNANETVATGHMDTFVTPSGWRYIGSRVERVSDTVLVLSSTHSLTVEGAPLRVRKTASFRAGDTYFLSTIEFRNTGDRPAIFAYGYGDEPWLGNFGSSGGNVGWVEGRIIQTVGAVDTRRYGYAGMFDYGNDLLGQGHGFTMAANFIQWFGPDRPEAFFSNKPDEFPGKYADAPLRGNSRFVGLMWGPVRLDPGETRSFTYAVGMASYDERRGMPVKPDVDLDYGRESGGEAGRSI